MGPTMADEFGGKLGLIRLLNVRRSQILYQKSVSSSCTSAYSTRGSLGILWSFRSCKLNGVEWLVNGRSLRQSGGGGVFAL